MRPDLQETLSERQVACDGTLLVLQDGDDVRGVYVRVHDDGGDLTEQIVGRDPAERGLQRIILQNIRLSCISGGRIDHSRNSGSNEALEHRKEQPDCNAGKRRGRGMAADYGEELCNGHPHADVEHGHQKENDKPCHLFAGGNEAGCDQPDPCHQSSDGEDGDQDRRSACKELGVDDGITVNRLRRQPV